jgi:hypothetical protein
MTYQPNFQGAEISLLKLSHASTLTTNDYLTLNSSVAGITNESISGDTITLPEGHYLINVSLGLDRTLYSNNCEYRIEVDGILTGSTGFMDTTTAPRSMNVDQAIATFYLSSAGDIKIKITNATAAAWTTQLNYSYLYIIRGIR